MGNQVVHFEVMGKDGGALRGFYGELFGWDFQELGGPMDYGLISGDSNGGGIGGGVGGTQEGDGHVTFYVHVDDLQTALDKAESLGGKTVMPEMDIPDGGKIALFTDPEGHTIGLVSGVGGEGAAA